MITMPNDDSNLNQIPFTGTRRGDGGTYLIIADGSDEFAIAAHYASRVAIARRAAVAVAHITDLQDFIHWGKVEEMMRYDLRQQAEKDIWQIAKSIHDDHDIFPSLYIREGKVIDKIIEIIEEDKAIRALILAGTPNSNNQGPLVSYFSNKGMSRLRIPVVIVPGHLDKESINAIT
jgi:nucleotide-binding universal stress UspA family protein